MSHQVFAPPMCEHDKGQQRKSVANVDSAWHQDSNSANFAVFQSPIKQGLESLSAQNATMCARAFSFRFFYLSRTCLVPSPLGIASLDAPITQPHVDGLEVFHVIQRASC